MSDEAPPSSAESSTADAPDPAPADAAEPAAPDRKAPGSASPRRSLKAYGLIGYGALCVALAGYVTGLAQLKEPPQRSFSAPPPSLSEEGLLPAPSYRELPNLRRGPNASFESRIDELREDVPAPTDPVVVDEDQRRAAAAALADRRAYEGAPPLVPHPVDAQDVAACLVCHEAGKDVDGVLAPAVPHGHELGNCTQCHAPPAPTFFAAAEPPPANTFEGARAPLHGERAHPLAPPVIPHATLMREDCRACHGVRARPGLRTTHPWRVNCTQCHASGTGFAR